MPEYLHPGVYIEETSYRGKPIEGVSTSTAGLVGRTTKGPEGKPTLVTSFAQFRREFGEPFPVSAGVTPGPGDYLGHAVRAFFDNGGRRAYIVRTLHGDAAVATSPDPTGSPAFPAVGWEAFLGRGTVATLPAGKALRASYLPPAPAAPARVPVTSLRGIVPGTTSISIFTRASSADPYTQHGPFAVTAVDGARSELIIGAGLSPANLGLATATGSYSADNVYITLVGATPTKALANLPVFQARYRGGDGNNYRVQIRSADRPPVTILADNAAHDQLTLGSTAGFYVGAVVEVHAGAAKATAIVSGILAGPPRVVLDTALAAAPPAASTVRVLELEVHIHDGAKGVVESFTGLTWNADPLADSFSRYYRARINDPVNGSKLVQVRAAPAEPAATLASQPVTLNGGAIALAGGDNGSPLAPFDLIGTDGGPGNRTGIEALRERTDIALVAVPGVTDEAVQGALLVHCETMKYRFAVLDGLSTSDVAAIQGHRNNYDSKYGGYYTPWLNTTDLATGRTMLVPPSGHVLGICARVDNERGVHKAPANEVVRGITGVDLPFGDGEQDVLNPAGINLIREFEGRGIRVWGGRCTTSDSEWKYVNVRRLFIFLEHSIDNGTQWVVFEPNNEALWQRVVETIESFMFGVWKSGALMGTTPAEAYFVRCDRTTMTQDDIDNGRLVCLIGVAPAYPAEFVIFRIGQFTASANRA
ncbi:MAG: phage tail sheath subtilisin-like domain-containing protein [Kofleriaceae bacterium]